MNVFMVEFVGVESPSILERVFDNKDDADVYKSEHENGKFAAVLSTSVDNVKKIYLQEILNVLNSNPKAVNPSNALGCLYYTGSPSENEAQRCVFGEHFHMFGYDIKSAIVQGGGNPHAGLLVEIMFGGTRVADELAVLAETIQGVADGQGKSPLEWKDVAVFVNQEMEDI